MSTRVIQKKRPQGAGVACGDCLLEEHPDVSAVPGPGPFNGAVEPASVTGVAIGACGLLPSLVIKVCNKKPTGRCLRHGIKTQDVAIARVKPLEVALEGVVAQCMQASVAALVAPDVAAIAHAGLPRVQAGGAISHTTIFAQVAISISVFSTSEERPIECNLLRVWVGTRYDSGLTARGAASVLARPLTRKCNDLPAVLSGAEDNVTRSANAPNESGEAQGDPGDSRLFSETGLCCVYVPGHRHRNHSFACCKSCHPSLSPPLVVSLLPRATRDLEFTCGTRHMWVIFSCEGWPRVAGTPRQKTGFAFCLLAARGNWLERRVRHFARAPLPRPTHRSPILHVI